MNVQFLSCDTSMKFPETKALFSGAGQGVPGSSPHFKWLRKAPQNVDLQTGSGNTNEVYAVNVPRGRNTGAHHAGLGIRLETLRN